MTTTTERVAIEQLILDLEDFFNAKNISKVAALYTSNGVLMPNNTPAVTGQEQIYALYQMLLEKFDIRISYQVEDIIISGDYAFARAASNVTTTVKANGAAVALENKNLFVLHRNGTQWAIAQYMFNTNHQI